MDTPDSPSNDADSPSSDADQKELVNINRQMLVHEQAGDVEALAGRLSERLVFRRANGSLVTKATFLRDVPQAARSVTNRRPRDDIQVTVSGDAAVVTLTVSADVTNPTGNVEQANFRNIRFFERCGGQWLLTCWFNERVP
jgi:ketosteroid isomerase-like protein